MATKIDPRVKQLLADIPNSKKQQAQQLAEHAIAIEEKLNETRDKIWNMDIVIPYDNGGGQMGLRENPAYKAYSSLLSQYQKVLTQINSMKEEEKPSTMFDWNK